MLGGRFGGRAFAIALMASVLLHALVFCFGGPNPVSSSLLRLKITLRASPEKLSVTPPLEPVAALPVRGRALPKPSALAVSRPPREGASVMPAPAPTPTLDMDAIRQQAREVGQGMAVNGNARTAGAIGQKTPVASPLERALAHQPILSETTLADGTRFVRFKGNTCLRVPAHVPSWRDPGVVPVQWMVTNC